HEERGAVLLRRDRKVRRRQRDDGEVLDADLDAECRAFVLADRAGHDDRRFLLERAYLGERLLGDVGLGDDRLHDPGAVAYLQEVELALAGDVVEPALELDFLTDVMLQILDVDMRHGYALE